MSTETNETLNKSIDTLIDEIFTEPTVEKSIDIAGDSQTKADAVTAPKPGYNKPPKNPSPIDSTYSMALNFPKASCSTPV